MMEPNEELLKFVDEVSQMTPRNGTDYCKGFHFAVMIFKRHAQGKDPFNVDLPGMSVRRVVSNDSKD